MKTQHFGIGVVLLMFTLYACETAETEKPSFESTELNGSWRVSESNSVYKSINTYDVTISSTSESILSISNFYGLGNASKINATVDVINYSVSMPRQDFDNNFILIKGSGNISDDLNTIRIYYEIDDNSGQVDQVDATYTRL